MRSSSSLVNIGKHFLGGVTGSNFCSTGGGGGGGSLGRQIGGASLLLNILLNEGLYIRYREDDYSTIIFDLVYWLLFYSIIYDAILDIFVMNYWRKVIRKIAACSKKIKMYRAIILKQVPQKIPVRIVILWTSLTYLLSNLSLVVSLNKFDILELSESPVRVLILLLKLFVDTFLEDGCFLNRLANSEKKITKKILHNDIVEHWTKILCEMAIILLFL